MKLQYTDFLIIIVIGFLLLVADRYIRIESFTDIQSCGIDKGPCPFGTRCMNGICSSTTQPTLQKTMLPVFP